MPEKKTTPAAKKKLESTREDNMRAALTGLIVAAATSGDRIGANEIITEAWLYADLIDKQKEAGD